MVDIDKQRQEAQYFFPYHYLPHFDKGGIPRISRSLSWGFEYLTYTKVIRDEMAAIMPAPESILDVGCGDGYFLNNLNLSIKKIGIDLSHRAISFAKAFATDTIFEVRDIQDLTTEYDVVTCIEVLEHVPDDMIEHFVANMIRLIKKGGYLIVSVPTTVVALNPKHYRHYDETLLSAHLETNSYLELMKEHRVFRVSRLREITVRLLYNRFWTINYSALLKAFWAWHCRSRVFATERDGAHIVRVYRKKF